MKNIIYITYIALFFIDCKPELELPIPEKIALEHKKQKED